MAELALGFVGTAVGGALGGPIGAAVGGALGSTAGKVVDNLLFADTQRIEGPRLDDLTVSVSTYGVPIPLVYGPQNRLAGNVIWSTDRIETATETESGGKGAPSAEATNYTYSLSCAVGLGEGPITSLKRVWANKKLIFDIDENDTSSPTNDDPIAAATASVGMVATRDNGTHTVFDTIRFYQGNGTQQIDPTIESYLGTANTQAYRHHCYMVITDLQLADFGNTMPSWEVELSESSSTTASNIVADICARAGITDLSTTQLTDAVKGYIVSQPVTAYGAIQPLSLAYSFDAAEVRGEIRFIKRGGGMEGVIEQDDMGAVEGGTDKPGDPVKLDRAYDIVLPDEASISFRDPNLDFQVNTQTARRLKGSSSNKLSSDVPLTLSSSEGRRLADRMLFEAWAARRVAKFQVSDRYHLLAPGDVKGIRVGNLVYPFKVQRVTRGANGVIEVEARFDDPEVYASTALGADGTIPANAVQFVGETRLLLLDMPIGREVDDDAGFYWGAGADVAGWRGAQILRSMDGGTNYSNMATTSLRAKIGDVATALPSGPSAFWDRGNTLDVVMHYSGHTLSSVTELEVLNGANAAWLGGSDGQDGEVIQFQTATLIAAGTYRLSKLLRGRLGTDHAIAAHGSNEVFVALDSAVRRNSFGADDWDKLRHFKPVSILTTEADTTAQTFTNGGEGKTPRSPVHVHGERDSSNNLTITWKRRSRITPPGLGYGPTPLGEATEAYEIDVLAGSPASVVRTITATSETASYTAAQQTTDGLTPGDPVSLNLYQMSDVRGRGRVRTATV